MATDLTDFFTHGSEYGDKNVIDEPRSKCCKSCAFSIDDKASVRPADVSLDDLIKHAEDWDYDAFYCHCSEGGNFKICAGWAAQFPEKFAPKPKKAQVNQALAPVNP